MEDQILAAVLIDAVSIQQYVFTSNKLRENIGASFIVEKLLYRKTMIEVLKRQFSEDVQCFRWDDETSGNFNLKIAKAGTSIECEIGYIGGGNALLLFKTENSAKRFVRAFSKEVLLKYPGLQLVFGFSNAFDLGRNYQDNFNSLLLDLKQRKSRHQPVVNIQKHGITSDCPWSNNSAEVFEPKSKKYVSLGSQSKIKSAEIAQFIQNQQKLYPALADKYILTDDLEKWWQKEETLYNQEGAYIAVIHIDGNGMGKIFSKIDTVADLRKKSKAVSTKASQAMAKLIDRIIKDYESQKLDELILNETPSGKILPLRPILVGGDDVTFICEGKLGIYLAETFISFFYDEQERGKHRDEDKLMDGACAGIAIVKNHFPFYKAVELAEELCHEAKKVARPEGNSCMSFYYSATTFSGNLSQLRQRTHQSMSGNMYFGPYIMFQNEHPHSIEKLKSGISFFKNLTATDKDKKWPQNKVMALRDVIVEDKSAQELFEKEIAEAGLKLPNGKQSIWENKPGDNREKQSPFFDQIELMDFYPNKLLTDARNENNL